MLPTNNIYQRTFYIKIGKDTGTCFTIDVDNHQYVVKLNLIKPVSIYCVNFFCHYRLHHFP